MRIIFGMKTKSISKVKTQLEKNEHIDRYIAMIYRSHMSGKIVNISQYAHKMIWPYYYCIVTSDPKKRYIGAIYRLYQDI